MSGVKSSVQFALALALMCAPGMVARSADAPPAKGSGAALISAEMSGRDVDFLQESDRIERSMLDVAGRLKEVTSSPAMKVLVSEILDREREIEAELGKLRAEKGMPSTAKKTRAREKDPFGELRGPKLEKTLVEALIKASAARLDLLNLSQESGDREIRRFAVKQEPAARDRHRRLARIAGVVES
jgi:hypothetical protein